MSEGGGRLPSGIAALRAGLPWFFVVGSGSMRPVLPTGATVEIVPCPQEHLRVGDIVCVDRPDGPVIHRIVGREADHHKAWFVIRGDRCPVADPTVNDSQVVGRLKSLPWGAFSMRADREPGRTLGRLVGKLWPLLATARSMGRKITRGPAPRNNAMG